VSFPYTNYDWALMMRDLSFGDLFFIIEKNTYFIWQSNNWAESEQVTVESKRFELMRQELHFLIDKEKDPKIRERMFRVVLTSGRGRNPADTKSLFRSLPDVRKTVHAFDYLNTILPCRNGTYDLVLHRFYPSFRADRNTRLLGTEFEEEADCPEWKRFIRTVTGGDQAIALYLQMVCGYLLPAGNPLQKMFIIYGPAATGKTTFIEVIQELIGTYARRTTIHTFNGAGTRNALAGLQFTRLAIIDENDGEESGKLSGALIKQVISGEKVEVRYLYREFFEYAVRFKILNTTNHLPSFKNFDDGIKRRLVVIPFLNKIPEFERDPELKDKLLLELPGILNWAVEGWSLVERFELRMPLKIEKLLNEYSRNYNSLERFLHHCCYQKPGEEIQSMELYQAYREYCRIHGEKYPMSHNTLARRLRERGVDKIRRSSGTYYRGLKLKDQDVLLSGQV
jgi:putative DNA primase/helicase